MKKGESPDVSLAWWKRSQPKGLKSAAKLESALKDYEDAKKAIEKGDPEAAKAALDALGMIDSGAKAVVDEATKAKGDEMQWTADCLKKMGRLTDAERKWVDEHAEGDDDEGMFSDEEVYKQYLVTGLRRLRSAGEMHFGFVLGKKAEDHRIALHKSKSAKALGSMLAKETGLHQFSFGIARPDPDEGAGVLMLYLEGRQLPGMAKKGERMLKKFKPLPFTKLRLFVDGQEVQDLVDPDDTDSDDDDARPDPQALEAALKVLIEEVKKVSDPALKGDLARMASQAAAALRGGNLGAAGTAIEALRQALAAAPKGDGTQGNGAAGNGTVAASAAVKLANSGKVWSLTLAQIDGELGKLRQAITKAYEADGLSGELAARFDAQVAQKISDNLKPDLAATLAKASGTADPAQQAQLLAEAREMLKTCRAFIDGNAALLQDLDANPFEPIKAGALATRTLASLEQAVG